MKNIALTIAIFSLFFAPFSTDSVAQTDQLAKSLRRSLVYLEVSSVEWHQLQPWRQSDVQTQAVYGCAVGENLVLTTALPLANAVAIQARCYDQNEYIPARALVVDYEINLCLLQLDAKALKTALKPVQFKDNFKKKKEIYSFWLSGTNQVETGQATLDRAQARQAGGSFCRTLHYIASRPSRLSSSGELYCLDGTPLGIASWASEAETALIPAGVIRRFLSQAQKEPYGGFGAMGFEYQQLLDPTVRRWLEMPPTLSHGVYVSTVYKIGSGSKELRAGDVILTVDGKTVNPYGKYEHPIYDKIDIDCLISEKPAGEPIQMTVFRSGKTETMTVAAERIRAEQMLVPYHHFDRRVPYCVVGGYVFLPLSRDYLKMWGDNWQGKAPPHLVQYLQRQAFNPTEGRRQIVILSYVLPDETNLGYQQLGRLVVQSVNGKPVRDFKAFLDALHESTFLPYHTIEFELGSPTLVISKTDIDEINRRIQQNYGIRQGVYIEQ